MKYTRTWIIAAFSAVAGVCLCFGWVYMYTVTFDILHKRSSAIQELARLSGQDSRTRAMSMNVRDTRDERELLTYLIFDADLLEAIQQIENTAESAGATIEITSVGNQQQVAQSVRMTPMVITLGGSYTAIFDTVRRFETFPGMISVSEVHFERPEKGLKVPWAASLRLEVFHRPDGVAAASTQ